ncbi:rod shape-determining protein RodA [Marinicellulosiphila megalodicopiae]|uniref:rod shape-determining protein RodA n=1 Tax=Marinicellulosiphila megalodicopiae TaxID=2724896 RepID=UPI003BB1079D
MNNSDFSRQTSPQGLRKPVSIYQKARIDWPIFGLIIILIGFGLTVLYSADSNSLHKFDRQIANLTVGIIVMLVFSRIHPRHFQFWSPIFYLIGLVMLALVLFTPLGVTVNGATRWLSVPIIGRFQPSEIIKLTLPIVVAGYLGRYAVPISIKYVAVALVIIFVPTILINRQPDLGTSLLIASSGMLVIFFAGLRWRWIFLAVILAAAGSVFMWFYGLEDYQKNRILTLLDSSDSLGASYNSDQAAIAIGSGGFSGKGFLQGTQSQLNFVPENDTDFIISVLAEEFGFVGFLALLFIYLLIVIRGFYISTQAYNNFQRFLAAALTFTFFIYVFVNIAMVSGILPVVGVPLPLVSYGGTSVVTMLASFGVLMSISTHRNNE